MALPGLPRGTALQVSPACLRWLCLALGLCSSDGASLGSSTSLGTTSVASLPGCVSQPSWAAAWLGGGWTPFSPLMRAPCCGLFTGRVELSHSPVASRHADAHVLSSGSSVIWLSQNHVASLLLYTEGQAVTKVSPGLRRGDKEFSSSWEIRSRRVGRMGIREQTC